MIPLDQTAADRPLSVPAGHGPGAECSVTAGATDPAAGHRPAGPAPADTVPQPRPAGGSQAAHPRGRRTEQVARRSGGPQDDGAAGRGETSGPRDTTADNDTTAENLRTGLGARLRTAYEQGATLADLAVACRRTTAETRNLLLAAGADLSRRAQLPAEGAAATRPAQQPGQRTDRPADRSEERPAVRDERPPAAGRPARGARSANRRAPAVPPATASPAPGPAPAKRPSPARRLSRLHPRPQQDTSTPPPPPERPLTPVGPEPVSEAPLGILIGGTPNLPEPENRPQERRYVLAEARMIRPGRGTCLVVLPSWRPAIAVSVPTEQLLAATGLDHGQLPCAVLSVFINPEALHDRELGLHGWRVRPAKRGGARNRPD
ncbi:hypothetical protein GCM10018781_31420 [Kitasatospora indigofera]|uniref:Uncharacterized protein n=1 Tax=Kitasatospora indigofera TaxID=67307 RepID=A0A919FR70_9ACTN|nr:hypothetical protein [Kitasatospora indigofera]GHH70896.1 hypothetical protein GCM10018781_31420 [Kitasatospora indigofera]